MKKYMALVMLGATMLSTACSRGVSVGSASPGAAYTVSVTNSTSTSMDVSYNDGSDHSLGTVAAGRSDRFVVAGTKTASVSVTGHGADGRTSGPYQVVLTAGATPKVTLH